jgi:SAM-dependent methyltransferase
MHDNSMKIMEKFVKEYNIKTESVVDVGAYDINGTYRPLFPKAKYIGVDTNTGPNVDVVTGSEEWKKLKNIDYVISGQTLEHVADRSTFMAGIFDILKSGGILCIIAPSAGEAHYYPIFTGNVSESEMVELVTNAGFEVISCTLSDVPPFMDNCCIAKKPEVVKPIAKKGTKIDESK